VHVVVPVVMLIDPISPEPPLLVILIVAYDDVIWLLPCESPISPPLELLPWFIFPVAYDDVMLDW